MIHYTFSIANPNQQYIQIKVEAPAEGDTTRIQLPSWRPGRYELGNFAKNVKGFNVLNERSQKVDFKKITKDCWEVDTKECTKITIEYNYFASQLNAGSTFLDHTQLYVNPVNCCVYIVGKENDPVRVKLNTNDNWQVACSMKKEGDFLLAKDFDELADSPFICSPNLQHGEYKVKDTLFHIWFSGEVKPKWEKLIKDFTAFTKKQIEKFNEFPTNEYHFLIHILPFKAYHGVEHSKSTVISLGPSYEVFNSLYKELLGVCSHELYHTWNVKAIRPIELFPYDFTKENYSELGYICEGVTTYMGDLFLLKSKIFNEEQYFNELIPRFQAHFDNHARFNYSVAQSSFDTWLDGYEAGAPNRKVSIYTEGSILALAMDIMIIKATDHKKSLDNVMKNLYFNYALKNKGVSEADFKAELTNVSGISFDEFFDKYIHGCHSYEGLVMDTLEEVGLELDHAPSKIYSHAHLGLKCMIDNGKTIAKIFYPGGPADLGGLMLDDQIIAVNGIAINGDLDNWLNYFHHDLKVFTVQRANRVVQIDIPEVNRHFYSEYSIKKIKKPTQIQENAYLKWVK